MVEDLMREFSVTGAVMGNLFSCAKRDVWQVNNRPVIGDGYANRDATQMSYPL